MTVVLSLLYTSLQAVYVPQNRILDTLIRKGLLERPRATPTYSVTFSPAAVAVAAAVVAAEASKNWTRWSPNDIPLNQGSSRGRKRLQT